MKFKDLQPSDKFNIDSLGGTFIKTTPQGQIFKTNCRNENGTFAGWVDATQDVTLVDERKCIEINSDLSLEPSADVAPFILLSSVYSEAAISIDYEEIDKLRKALKRAKKWGNHD